MPQSLPAEPKLAELPVEQDEEAKAYEQMITQLDSGTRAEAIKPRRCRPCLAGAKPTLELHMVHVVHTSRHARGAEGS